MKKYTYFILLLIFASFNAKAHPSWGIAVDEDRNIYFADIMHNGMGSVFKLSSDGKLELLFENFHAHNVSLDKNGNLVTAHGEMDRHTMIRLSSNGEVDTLFHANDYRKFNGGNCTYGLNAEIVFSAEHFLWRLDDDGNREKVSDHFFDWNQTVYVDDEGFYYCPEIGDGKGKLYRIDPDGKANLIADNLITKSDRPYDKHADVLMGVSKGCDGLMYIAELAGRRVIRINGDGTHETFYQSEGSWSPTGLDFFSGDAYIFGVQRRSRK